MTPPTLYSSDTAMPIKGLHIEYLSSNLLSAVFENLPANFILTKYNVFTELKQNLCNKAHAPAPRIFIFEADLAGECFEYIEVLKNDPLGHEFIIILVSSENDQQSKVRALQAKIQDYYSLPFPLEHLVERLDFLVNFKSSFE